MEDKGAKNGVQKEPKTQTGLQKIVVREFEPADNAEVQRIFAEGLMEMVSDTAFRGLLHHPESILLYTTFIILCFVITMCWWVIGLLPVVLLWGRYFYSTRVIRGYLEHAMSTDMGDIEGFYLKSSDSCLWVAVLEGKVVGVVAAVCQKRSGGAVELQRMSVDQRFRQCGIGSALGRKVLEFAVLQGCSTIVLGTTAYKQSAHRLYQSLGFQCERITNGYVTPGTRCTLLERIFYRVCLHHYIIDMQNCKLA
ncbi:N-acetylaspartate synthetase-like [Notolabrus celidotus]|uniref:N-acetylaspartate synthetase-like n=1 Tax=Notolabrus celidotus TaxID=1203425 RepID=UPI0014901E7E|nr:N-acetylaspartate synthetase-like [Notolabrus celidotus]